MINFIFYFLIIFCFLILAAIVFHRVPLFAELSQEERMILEKKKGVIQRCLEINYKHYLFNLLVGVEKFLRRIKIWFLKIENLLTKCISRLRKWSEAMAHKSKEWIKQRETKRKKKMERKIHLLSAKKNLLAKEEPEKAADRKEEKLVRHASQGDAGGQDDAGRQEERETVQRIEKEEKQASDISQISFSELKKPIQEEQKWINLIIENPKNITAYKFLGLLYWRQHNYADAKASLEMATRLGSKDKKVKEILEEIKQSEKIENIKEE
jgi:hypothetical protein